MLSETCCMCDDGKNRATMQVAFSLATSQISRILFLETHYCSKTFVEPKSLAPPNLVLSKILTTKQFPTIALLEIGGVLLTVVSTSSDTDISQ